MTTAAPPVPAAGAARPAPAALRPVLALADRLRTSARLAVLVLVLVVPCLLATWSYAGSTGAQTAFAVAERDGVDVLGPALSALREVAAGRPADLAPLEAAAARHPALDLDAQLAQVRSAAARPGDRVALATALADLVTQAGNTSNLILDPDLDSFYAMDAQVVQLPKALVGLTRASSPGGATGLADRAVLAGTLTSTADALRSDVRTAVRETAAPGLQERLAGLGAAADAAQAAGTALTRDLAASRPLAAVETAEPAPAAAALDDLLARRVAQSSAERTRVLAVTAAGLLLAVWFGAAVWWRTRRDVALAVGGVEALAAHELVPRALPTGQDELGDLGRAVERARRELGEQDAALQRAEEHRRAQQQASFRDQRLAEREGRRRAQEIIDETVTAVVAELAAVVDQVREVDASASGIGSSVRQVDAVARDVVTQAGEADRRVSALGQSLTRVASIAELIAAVAGQTRLLALNATIEAVRAETAGQGFAVVAGEVKQLATSTAESTGEISSTIALLERDASAVASAITAVASGIGAVDSANASLSGVADEQGQLVSRLVTRLEQARERVEALSTVASRLERREAERVPLDEPALVRAGRTEHRTRLRDLSLTGVRTALEDTVALPEGTFVELETALGGEPLVLAAMVVRTGGPGGVGLTFVDLTQAEVDRLAAHVARLTAAL